MSTDSNWVAGVVAYAEATTSAPAPVWAHLHKVMDTKLRERLSAKELTDTAKALLAAVVQDELP